MSTAALKAQLLDAYFRKEQARQAQDEADQTIKAIRNVLAGIGLAEAEFKPKVEALEKDALVLQAAIDDLKNPPEPQQELALEA